MPRCLKEGLHLEYTDNSEVFARLWEMLESIEILE